MTRAELKASIVMAFIDKNTNLVGSLARDYKNLGDIAPEEIEGAMEAMRVAYIQPDVNVDRATALTTFRAFFNGMCPDVNDAEYRYRRIAVLLDNPGDVDGFLDIVDQFKEIAKAEDFSLIRDSKVSYYLTKRDYPKLRAMLSDPTSF